jgi:hypothetical protein
MASKKPKQPTFTFRDGARVSGIAPQVAGEELARIREKHGQLTPRVTVDESRPKNAPLHGAFEWNDGKAADEYRLQQARGLIRAVCVVSEATDEACPVYVHVREDASNGAGSYQPLELVVQEPDLFAAALAELQAKLSGAQRAIEELHDAARRMNKPTSVKKLKTVSKHLTLASNAARDVA